jgi:acetyl esterase
MAEFDSEIAAWLAALPETVPNPTVSQRRAGSVARNAALRERLGDRFRPAAEVEVTIAGRAARVYRPAEAGPLPTVAYFHGGGWVIGDFETHRGVAERLCVQAGVVVVMVDYRRAPEDPFPAAFDDCLAATREIAARSHDFGGGPLVVAGDSAGGQLAISVAMASRADGPELAAQLLLYPVADVRGDYRDPAANAPYPSRAERVEGFGLTTPEMAWFADQYGADADDWRVSPLAGQFAGLPPAVVHTAGFDPLRDEGNALAEALGRADVSVIHREFETLPHSYFSYGGVSAAAEQAATAAAADLRTLLDA